MKIYSFILFYILSPLYAADPDPALNKGETSSAPIETHSFAPAKEKVFTPLSADPWETQCALFVLNHAYLLGKIGTDVPIFQTKRVSPGKPDEILRLDVTLLTYNIMRFRREEGGGFDLDSSDTKFGLNGNYRKGNFFGRVGVGHISAHLADGQLWPTADRPKVGYSREFLQMNLSYEWTHLTPYIGTHYVFEQRHPDEYLGKDFFIFQWGGSATYPLYKSVSLFSSADWQSREEYQFNINQSYSSGFQIQGAFHNPYRLLIQYYQGHDPRGEYYNSRTKYWGLGMQVFI